MKKSYSFTLAFLVVNLLTIPVWAQTGNKYVVAGIYHIAGSSGWDYIAVGPGNNRLYVSHATQVNILDQQTGDSVGVITNTNGVHGIAFATDLHKGYTSNGRSNSVSVFNIKTNEVLSQITTGDNPDAIIYEPFSKTIITCNGRSNNLSLIDPVTDKVIATIPIGGKPEAAVSDGKGKLYVNIEDKSTVAVVNLATNKVENHWPLAPAEGPTGLAIDQITGRLFVGCDKQLVILDKASGKIITHIAIGEGCDGVAFDNNTKTIFAACGAGVLAIVHEDNADKYTLVNNLTTKKSARTIAIDESLHTVYLPAADFGEPAPGQKRAPVIPGTFQVMLVKY
jgi:YVTN family beta-propeller protein